ncbi:MAG: hypothetical protein IJE23_07035 [Tyzzerella sp.]|nr:hypothetical protein [Tyzzerella sp.]
MKYYYALYMDEYAKENQADIIRKIENDKWQMNIYLVALTKGEKNHMEVFHSVLLIQKALSKDDLFVVGIANGYFEALELVEKITQEVYDETGGVDIRNYILQKQRKHEEERV